ncbi:hypothetical protein CEP80_06120 [Jonesia denitrificans]|nr:hypothetical protein CEP80_06120 [Jonesia denitrificans]
MRATDPDPATERRTDGQEPIEPPRAPRPHRSATAQANQNPGKPVAPLACTWHQRTTPERPSHERTLMFHRRGATVPEEEKRVFPRPIDQSPADTIARDRDNHADRWVAVTMGGAGRV